MADRTPAQIGASNRRRVGRIRGENVSAPGAVGAAPELASTALGGADMPDATCSIDGCDKPSHGKGWCRSHYMRWWRYGDPSGSSGRNDSHEDYLLTMEIRKALGEGT